MSRRRPLPRSNLLGSSSVKGLSANGPNGPRRTDSGPWGADMLLASIYLVTSLSGAELLPPGTLHSLVIGPAAAPSAWVIDAVEPDSAAPGSRSPSAQEWVLALTSGSGCWFPDCEAGTEPREGAAVVLAGQPWPLGSGTGSSDGHEDDVCYDEPVRELSLPLPHPGTGRVEFPVHSSVAGT